MFKSLQSKFARCGSRGFGIFALRFITGIIFFSHGLVKFLDTANGIAFFNQIGLNQYWFYTIAVIEIVGGLSILLGIFTRYASAILGLLTVAFAVSVKIPNILLSLTVLPPDLNMPAFLFKTLIVILQTEVDLVLLGATILLFTSGAGRWSISFWCKCRCHNGENIAGKKCGVCSIVGCEDTSENHCMTCTVHPK